MSFWARTCLEKHGITVERNNLMIFTNRCDYDVFSNGLINIHVSVLKYVLTLTKLGKNLVFLIIFSDMAKVKVPAKRITDRKKTSGLVVASHCGISKYPPFIIQSDWFMLDHSIDGVVTFDTTEGVVTLKFVEINVLLSIVEINVLLSIIELFPANDIFPADDRFCRGGKHTTMVWHIWCG